MSHEFSSSHGLNPSQDAELREQEASKREATELINALKGKEGKKAFFLVLDDDPFKLDSMKEFIASSAEARNTGCVISLKKDGESAIRLYRAFREQEEPERRNKVVAVLDGSLSAFDRYESGKEVAQQLIEISTENGWEVPYLVGISGESQFNRELQQTYPDHYVSSFYGNSEKEFAAIDAKLQFR